MDGSNIKFENIEKSKVRVTRPPRATVPPKSDIIKTENPNNNITEV